MEEADIGGLLARNEIAADTLVWRDGLSNWTEAQSTELGGFFSDAGSPTPPVSIVNHDEHIAGYFGYFSPWQRYSTFLSSAYRRRLDGDGGFHRFWPKGGLQMPGAASRSSRRWIETRLAGAGMEAPTLSVSRPYLDRAVAHHLTLNTEKGEAPPLGLLQVAETIGGADWQPAHMAFSETLAGLIAEVPSAMREPAALASMLRRSGDLADLEFVAQSWFEDDPQVARAVERAGGRGRAKLATYLLQSVIARHRDRWA